MQEGGTSTFFFRMAVSFGIEDARLGSVCYCASENKFLIFLFIYAKGG